MDIRGIRTLIPEGFRVRAVGERICVYDASRERVMIDLAGDGAIGRRSILRLRGRGRPAVVEAEGERLVVRHYYHGGLLRRLTGDLFFGVGRFLNELRVLESARRGGAAVPRPVGLLLEPVFPFFFRADLVTVYIPQSVDLLSYYRQVSSSGRGLPSANMAPAVAAAGRQAALLHRSGILHGDLQVKNILIRTDRRPPEVIILDLDRARFGKAGREKNLRRLYRSYLKMKLSLPSVSRFDPIRFLRAYAPADLNFRRRMIADLRRRRGLAALRQLKWKLSFHLRGGYYARSMEEENG